LGEGRIPPHGSTTEDYEEFVSEDYDYHDLYTAVSDDAAACDYCAGAFGVDDAIADTDVRTVDDNDGHPSVRSLVDDDYEIITF